LILEVITNLLVDHAHAEILEEYFIIIKFKSEKP